METMVSLDFMSVPMLKVDEEIMNFNKAIKWVISQ